MMCRNVDSSLLNDIVQVHLNQFNDIAQGLSLV